MNTDSLMRKVGVTVITGSLVFAQVPVAAIAEEANAGQAPQAADGTTPPEKPEGEAGDEGGMGEEPPGGFGGGPGDEAPGGQPGEGGGMGGANTMTFDYSGSYSGAATADGEPVSKESETIEATESDVNAALAQNGGVLTLTDVTLTKSGDDTNGDNCNFYGLNSVLLAVGEASSVVIKDSQLSATSEGSNGIFATDNATALAKGVTISTKAGNSRGLDATYGGTILAGDVDITTKGDHSGGVATDRGGGTISLVGGAISTAGSGSPLLYSTGNIQVSNITGVATGSQLVGMEGLNTVLISNSTLESTQTEKTASDPVADGVIIYQSTSGDAEASTGETATFQAVDSTLKSAIQSGSMFYLTNTTADVVLKKTTLDFDSTAANLLYAAGNDANNWGSAGKNGATVKFTGIQQELRGNVVADTISSIDLHLTDETTWTGAASIEENSAGSTSETPITVNVGSTSTWVVTADSTISALNVADGGKVVDANGKVVTIVSAGQTVVSGDSDLTVTVTGAYSTSYDESSAGSVSTDTIDRTAYTEAFGEDADATQASDSSAADSNAKTASATSWWDAIVAWFKGLFSL
ncbi:hypothetical protein [Paratractidigestivibacter sp.]|uniref:hypothetical protein n=1 Tax=Paratractidigestivibacter sp. TaxID=2847316 RepID=UPI002AC99020|nr:hypothetical protein [Paratractidigestivibacter sp.]